MANSSLPAAPVKVVSTPLAVPECEEVTEIETVQKKEDNQKGFHCLLYISFIANVGSVKLDKWLFSSSMSSILADRHVFIIIFSCGAVCSPMWT